MDLHLGHEFLLLSLDDTDGRSHADSLGASLGYCGAVVAQWMFDGRLVAVEADGFVLRDQATPWRSLATAATCVRPAPESLQTVIQRVYGWNPVHRMTPALEELAEAGVLAPTVDRFLGIPWRTRWPERDGSVERTVVARLRHHVRAADATTPPQRDDALLGVLRGTRLLHTVWTPDELASVKPAIDERTDRAPIGRDVHQVVQAMHAAIIASMTYTTI